MLRRNSDKNLAPSPKVCHEENHSSVCHEENQSSVMQVGLVLLFCCHACVSVSLTILNKKIMVAFTYPWSTVLIQCCASVAIISIIGSFTNTIGPVRKSHLNSALLVSSLFVLCLISSFYGLQRVHVPMVVVGRNLTPFCTAFLEVLIVKTPLKLDTLAPLVISVTGSIIYAYGDSNTETTGVSYVLLNSAIVAVTCVSEKRVVGKEDQTPLGWSLYRNALAVPFLLVVLLCGLEDTRMAVEALRYGSWETWWLLFISSCFSASAGFMIFKLQTRVSATSTQVANLGYKVVTTIVSLIVFPESRRDIGLLAYVGYLLSFCGIALYVFRDSLKNAILPSFSTKADSVVYTMLGAATMQKSVAETELSSVDGYDVVSKSSSDHEQ